MRFGLLCNLANKLLPGFVPPSLESTPDNAAKLLELAEVFLEIPAIISPELALFCEIERASILYLSFWKAKVLII
jgi:hypothetical protein